MTQIGKVLTEKQQNGKTSNKSFYVF